MLLRKIFPFFHFIVKENEKKEKVIVVVDFEHWFYSLKKLYHLKPDIVSWKKQLEEKYDIQDFMVFGDFSYPEIKAELPKIRRVTNTIIETEQSIGESKKDMTDFIMLDYIYQLVSKERKVRTYILFTGDAHFQSVVKYLQQKKKTVVVYGIKNAFSTQLKEIASEAVELPATEEVIQSIYPLVVNNLAEIEDKEKIIPTFSSTARWLSKEHDISEDLIKTALSEMLNKGLLSLKNRRVEFNKFVKVLSPNWEALEQAGLWEY